MEQFGPEGVPAFLSHLLQDSFTTDGIPILPNAWSIKQGLAAAGLAPKTASGLVALTASEAVAFVGIGMAIAKLVVSVERERRRRGYMNAAADALESNDFSAAAENYKRAIEIKASPAAFIALGQVYVRRTATRPYAFQMFKKAMDELASESDNTFQFGGATISLRGVAGLQALSTADTLGDRYPQFFDEEVTNLVNGTVASFRRVAEQQEAAYANWIPNSIVTPPLLSAATNRFLAAQAACQYPLLDERGALVTRNTEAALRNLGLAAQYDEDGLRTRMSQLRQIWAAAVLPPDEAEIALASA